MATRIVLTIVHEVCPENEHLDDDDLHNYNYNLAALSDDTESYLASPAVSFTTEVQRG